MTQQHLLYFDKFLDNHHLLVDYDIVKDLMLYLVMHLCGGGGKDIPYKGHSFKEFFNRKPTALKSTHFPNLCIVKKLDELQKMDVIHEIVSNLLWHYESRMLIYSFNGF
jgi:hypothetical protein